MQSKRQILYVCALMKEKEIITENINTVMWNGKKIKQIFFSENLRKKYEKLKKKLNIKLILLRKWKWPNIISHENNKQNLQKQRPWL